MYHTRNRKNWTAKDYAEFWQQQISKTFEYRQRAFRNSNDVSKSLTITRVDYEEGNRVYLHQLSPAALIKRI